MQSLINVALLGALSACTRVSAPTGDSMVALPTTMPQLAADSALAAHLDRLTGDAGQFVIELAQTEELSDGLEDETLLAQADLSSTFEHPTALINSKLDDRRYDN